MKHAVNPHSNEDNFEIVLPKESSHKEEIKDLVSSDVERADSKVTQKSQCEDNNIEKVFVNCDISEWPEREQMSKYLDYWIKVGSIKIQNSDSRILNSKSHIQKDGNIARKCKASMFEKKVKNRDLK